MRILAALTAVILALAMGGCATAKADGREPRMVNAVALEDALEAGATVRIAVYKTEGLPRFEIRAYTEVADLPEPEPEPQPEPQPEPEPEPEWADVYEPIYSGNDYGNPFKQEGVAYDENYEYTWYSQNVLGGSGLDALNANGRHVDEDTGFIVDGDGYIAVAMNGVEQGTVIDTKWGEAKVYDTKRDGAPYDGTVDVYTDF